ncbi:GNAT family N-acetyltransferase [Alloactinosynnema sp. L-07]|uniref:GNAT family N-acetyltransferase n=1 Tax=Alloactinosynnema sp. L-07 TaxID=1653480 RepID=UPI0006B4064C|nr:GNAT family protein [Alloactinosynnema sp. L-07]
MLRTVLTDDAELRALEPWHAEEFFAHLDAIRDHIGQWLAWAERIPDLDAAHEFLQGFADKRARDEGTMYGLWVHGELVGGVAFPVFDARAGICELGVWLAPHVTGRGLVGMAVQRMIDWAVFERGVFRIEWLAAVGNEPSIAVARRLGFTKEGVLRKHYPHGEVRHDMELWSVLADEWRARSVPQSQ